MILMLGLCEEVRVAENNKMNTSLVMLLTTRDADSHLACCAGNNGSSMQTPDLKGQSHCSRATGAASQLHWVVACTNRTVQVLKDTLQDDGLDML